MKKILFFLFLAAAGGYLLLQARPDLYYSNKLEYKNFTLWTRGPVPEVVESSLDKAFEKISSSELFKPDYKFDIYIPGSRNEFVFFTLFSNGEYSRVNPFNGNIFIAAPDFRADRARKAAGDSDYHSLSGEIIAAASRVLVRRSVETLTFLLIDDWKLRGYAERLSGGTGAFAPADLCSGKTADPDLQDYRYGMAVDFAMREGQLTVSELMGKDLSFESVEGRMKKIQCGN